MAKLSTELVRALGSYGHIGFTFVIAVFIGLGAGVYLDDYFFKGSTTPWFTFIGLAFGIAAGFKSLIDIVREQTDKPEDGED